MGGALVRLVFGADRERWWTYPKRLRDPTLHNKY